MPEITLQYKEAMGTSKAGANILRTINFGTLRGVVQDKLNTEAPEHAYFFESVRFMGIQTYGAGAENVPDYLVSIHAFHKPWMDKAKLDAVCASVVKHLSTKLEGTIMCKAYAGNINGIASDENIIK